MVQGTHRPAAAPGTFTSVAEPIAAINLGRHRNHDPKPFEWHATADKILEKVRRGRKTLRKIKSQTQH